VGSRLARRTLFAALFAVMVTAAVMLPALALAATPDEAMDAATALPSVPFGVDGTLTAVDYGSGDTEYESWHTIHMTAGQTISVTATLPAGEFNGFSFFSKAYMAGSGSLSSDPVDATHKRLDIMAPRTGTYYFIVWASAPGTYTVGAQERAAVSYKMSALTVPKTAKKSKSFSVSVRLSPDYDAILTPVRFYVERKSGSKWKKYKSFSTSITGGSVYYTKFSAKLKLPRGSFRVRARFADAAHPSVKYSSWKSVKVK
jgi:hypothetical protein